MAECCGTRRGRGTRLLRLPPFLTARHPRRSLCLGRSLKSSASFILSLVAHDHRSPASDVRIGSELENLDRAVDVLQDVRTEIGQLRAHHRPRGVGHQHLPDNPPRRGRPVTPRRRRWVARTQPRTNPPAVVNTRSAVSGQGIAHDLVVQLERRTTSPRAPRVSSIPRCRNTRTLARESPRR